MINTKPTMKNRIFNNPKSTLVGLMIAGICLYLRLKGYATTAEISGFLVASGLLAWVRDSIFKVKPE